MKIQHGIGFGALAWGVVSAAVIVSRVRLSTACAIGAGMTAMTAAALAIAVRTSLSRAESYRPGVQEADFVAGDGQELPATISEKVDLGGLKYEAYPELGDDASVAKKLTAIRGRGYPFDQIYPGVDKTYLQNHPTWGGHLERVLADDAHAMAEALCIPRRYVDQSRTEDPESWALAALAALAAHQADKDAETVALVAKYAPHFAFDSHPKSLNNGKTLFANDLVRGLVWKDPLEELAAKLNSQPFPDKRPLISAAKTRAAWALGPDKAKIFFERPVFQTHAGFYIGQEDQLLKIIAASDDEVAQVLENVAAEDSRVPGQNSLEIVRGWGEPFSGYFEECRWGSYSPRLCERLRKLFVDKAGLLALMYDSQRKYFVATRQDDVMAWCRAAAQAAWKDGPSEDVVVLAELALSFCFDPNIKLLSLQLELRTRLGAFGRGESSSIARAGFDRIMIYISRCLERSPLAFRDMGPLHEALKIGWGSESRHPLFNSRCVMDGERERRLLQIVNATDPELADLTAQIIAEAQSQ